MAVHGFRHIDFENLSQLMENASPELRNRVMANGSKVIVSATDLDI